jgi:hypothetical protein
MGAQRRSDRTRDAQARHIDPRILRAVSDSEKAPILKNYLDRYKLTVQRYFPIPAGSPPEAFSPYLAQYPVFELIPPRPATHA